jgi:hypothetical protein
MGIAGSRARRSTAAHVTAIELGIMVNAALLLASSPEWLHVAVVGAVALLLATVVRRSTGTGGA